MICLNIFLIDDEHMGTKLIYRIKKEHNVWHLDFCDFTFALGNKTMYFMFYVNKSFLSEITLKIHCFETILFSVFV